MISGNFTEYKVSFVVCCCCLILSLDVINDDFRLSLNDYFRLSLEPLGHLARVYSKRNCRSASRRWSGPLAALLGSGVIKNEDSEV